MAATMTGWEVAQPSPKKVRRYVVATWARAALEMKVAIWGTQPPKNQPAHGPKTREIHTNTPPQSGISLLRSRNAKAVNRIGTNPRRNAAGVLYPTARTTKPRVTARLYAGATLEGPAAT